MVRIVSISLPVLLACGLMHAAGSPVISTRDYSLHGELSYSYFKGTNQTHAEKLQGEVLRGGDRLRITTSIYGSNYPANVFLCDAASSCSYVQYREEVSTAVGGDPSRPWNNASVWVNSYRMPSHIIGNPTPLWLMTQAHAERARMDPSLPWLNAFGTRAGAEFYDQPTTDPDASVETFWPDEFASYLESFDFSETADPTKTMLQGSGL